MADEGQVREVEGLDYGDIATRLGATAGTVRAAVESRSSVAEERRRVSEEAAAHRAEARGVLRQANDFARLGEGAVTNLAKGHQARFRDDPHRR